MCLAIPGKVISVDKSDPVMITGKASFGGVVKDVNLAFVPDVKIGDYVIVHAGFALNILDESEANTVFDYLEQISRDDNPSDEKS
jgi:hydrogenase expression/formation protein HypC